MAGNSGQVDTIIDRAAVGKQVTDTTADLKLLEGNLVDCVKQAILLNAELSKANFKNYSTNAAAAARATAQVEEAEKKLAITTARLAEAQARLQQQNNRTAQSEIALTTAQQRQAAQQQRSAAAAQQASGAYQSLAAVYRQVQREAQNAGAQFGINSYQFRELSQQANGLRGRLDAIDQPLGNFQRNVGNYFGAIGQAFGRFYNIVRVAANILPGLGISGVFLLAYEGIVKAADALGIFTNKTADLGSNLKNLNAVYKEANQEAGQQATNLRILYTAATDVTNSTESRTRAVRELQKEFPDTFKNIKIETVLNGGAKDSYDELTKSILENARAKAIANKIGELAGKQLDQDIQKQKIANAQSNELARFRKTLQNGDVDLTGTGIEGGGGILAGNAEKQIRDRAKNATKIADQNKKILQDQIDFLTKLAGGNNKLADALSTGQTPKDKDVPDNRKQILEQRLKDAKLTLDAILADEKTSGDQRINAIADYENTVAAIITVGENNKVLTVLEANNKLKEIDKETTADRLKITADYQKELLKQFKDGAANQAEILKNSLDVADQFANQAKSKTQSDSDEALIGLANQYSKGLISTEQYNKQKADIEAQTNLDLQQDIISGLQFRIAIAKSLNEDSLSDEQKLEEAKRKLAKDTADNQIKEAERVAARRKQLADKEKELADSVANFVVSLVDAGFENRKNEIEDRKTRLDEQTQSEIDAVNRSLDTTANKADKIAIINAKAAAEKQRLDNLQKAEDVKKAKFDKAVSAARVIENTAVGVTSALGQFPPNIPLAFLIGALGAVQLATVLAQPIPKYEKGTKSAKGGLSIWGEKGMELAIEPSGKIYTSPDTATLANIPKGTEIIPHLQLMGMLKSPKLQQHDGERVPWQDVIKAIKGQKTDVNVAPQINIHKQLAKKQSWDRYSSNHFN